MMTRACIGIYRRYFRRLLSVMLRCLARKVFGLFLSAHDQGKPYDVVFMDILMPGMDGHQAAEIMRAREEKMDIDKLRAFKLVMITSLVDDANVSRAFFTTHASCYIVKPLEKEKVLDELKQNLVL